MTDTANAGAENSLPEDRTKLSATKKREDKASEDKQIGFFGRIILFVRQTIAEMKKVVYPTKEELWTYFLVVVVFVSFMMAFTGLVDLGFAKLTRLVFA